MKKILLLLSIATCLNSKAQFMPTDSLNLCEDSTTHGYTKYGTVSVGTYSCGTNKSIRIGTGTGADSIVFNLAVTPNTDSIKLEIGMPWRGGTKNPKVWVENFRNDTVPYLGVGNCSAAYIKFGGMSSRTSDGSIKVKLMDTISGFNMDGQFTYIKVVSKVVIGTGIKNNSKEENVLTVFPNPSAGTFFIRGNVGETKYSVRDLLGREIFPAEFSDDQTIDLSKFPKGIYFVRVGERSLKLLKE
jgi:hypothetical protein